MAPKKKGKGKKKKGGAGSSRAAQGPTSAGQREEIVPGATAHLFGLGGQRANLNGRRVRVEDQVVAKDGVLRFEVRVLEDGKSITVKAANLKPFLETDPALDALVKALQALAPGADPEEERRDWAGLPVDVLAKIAEMHIARTEAEWAAWSRREGHSEQRIQWETALRKRRGNCCLFVFARVCKGWRKAQLTVGGRLRTRVESDVILPGRVALARWALAEGCPRVKGNGMDMLCAAAFYTSSLELVKWLVKVQGFAVNEGVMNLAFHDGSGDPRIMMWLATQLSQR